MNVDTWLNQWHEVEEPVDEPEELEDVGAVDVWQDGVDRHRASVINF
jgi:hypothetical protein